MKERTSAVAEDYRRWRAPEGIAARATSGFRERATPSALGGLSAAGMGVAMVALVAAWLSSSTPPPPDMAPASPAALSLSRLSMPEPPPLTLPSTAQLAVPRLNQISIHFDIEPEAL